MEIKEIDLKYNDRLIVRLPNRDIFILDGSNDGAVKISANDLLSILPQSGNTIKLKNIKVGE